jgi:hypothetical protein
VSLPDFAFSLRRSVLGVLAAVGLFAFFASAAALAQSPLPPLQNRVGALGGSPARAPLSAEFSPVNAFTLEAWIFPTAPRYDFVAGKGFGPPGVEPHLGFGLFLSSSLRPEFNCTTGAPGSGRSAVSPASIPLRAWTHLAGVGDGTSLRLYVNGTLVATTAFAGTPAAPPGVPFAIGRIVLPGGGSNFFPFSGFLRQVRLWSVARTAEQIAASLGEMLPADRTGLVGAWPLDDASGARSLRDLSGAGRDLASDGHVSAAAALVTAGPFYADTVSPRDNALSSGLHQGVLLDFDGDGDLDAVYAQINYTQSSGGTPVRLRAFRNSRGTFADVTDAVLGTVTLVHPRHQFVGDFNGDGRPDVLFVGHGYDFPPFPGEQSRLLVSTPDGRLVEDPARLPTGTKFTHNVAAADIDRDGDLDIFMCNVASGEKGSRLYLNDGRGFFAENSSRLPREVLEGIPDPPIASHFVDVNRDGWPDLVLGPLGVGQNRLLMNDGAGRFVIDPRFTLPPKLVGPLAYTVNIESADFNADGWPDLVLSTDHWLTVPPDGTRNTVALQLLLNRGDGTFTDASAGAGIDFAPHEYWVEWMYPVDFSGDGRPDLVLHVAPRQGRTTRLLENLGTTPVTFRDVTEIYDHAPAGGVVLPGDIDRDGRIDFLAVTPDALTFSRNLKPLVPGRLANLSVRTVAGSGDDTLIAGFALGGASHAAASKPLLVRAVGPSLTAFGVENVLADPRVAVAPLGGTVLAANDNWSGTAALKSAFAAVGAFPLANDASRDAAFLVSPVSGAYTASVAGGQGVALVEVYDTGPGLTPRLTNLSARTLAGTGADALIAGFVVDGTLPKRLLLRAVGPTLAAFGVGGTLADPVLMLRTPGHDTPLATNDDWAGTAALKAAFASVGAFAFAADSSRDAALVLELPPGAYSVTVSGKNATTGVALVEVYELP